MSEQAVGDERLTGIRYARENAKSAMEDDLVSRVGQIGETLRRALADGGLTAAAALELPVTKAALADGFLPEGSIPDARVVYDTVNARAPLVRKMAMIPAADFPSASGSRVFRDDGRNPWKIAASGGFKHRSLPQDPATIAARLKHFAESVGLTDWAHNYHITNGGDGVPTVSTAVDGQVPTGASNAIWQYAIDLPSLTSYKLDNIDVISRVLSCSCKSGTKSDGTTLWADAEPVESASVIAISGGPMNEFTFLTSVKPEWIVGFRRVNFRSGEEWRKPFETPWRSYAQADAIKAILEESGEFDFPE